ncbi:MAG: MarR family transcriptional regulator [Pseudoruegeria sp.]
MTPKTPPAHANDMFCYGIYTASHVVNRAYTPHLAPLGLTYPQYITLTLLWERDCQKVTDLAGQLRMGTNTLTPLLKKLEGQGYITRNRGKKDGREIVVALTEIGRELQKNAPAITACMIEGTGLTQSELDKLQHLLLRVCSGLSDKA